MSYLIDTNVICEVVRQKPNDHVLKWFNDISDDLIYVSVLTIGEIRKGIEKLDQSKRKKNLVNWLESELPTWFQNRMLPVDKQVADRWGFLQAQMKKPLPAIDSLIAATALQHDFSLVTRNTRDFDYPLVRVINPWNS